MSRNSKNAKRHIAEKAASAQRVKGDKGPSQTKPLHGKKNAWWQKFPSYSAFIKGAKAKAKEQ